MKQKNVNNQYSTNRVENMLYICLLTIAFLPIDYIKQIPYFFPFYILLTITTLLFNLEISNIASSFSKFVLFFISFFVLIFIYSSIIHIINAHGPNYISRSFSNLLQLIVIIIFSYLFFKRKKNTSISIIFTSVILAYTITIFYALFTEGSSILTSFLSDERNIYSKSAFEQHDIGLSIGLLFIYFLFNSKKKKRIQMFLCILVVYLTFKRITLLAIVFTLIVYSIFRLFNYNNKVLKLYSFIVPIICIIYIIIIKYGIFALFFTITNLNSMSRVEIYEYFSNYYIISPTFMGHGDGFVSKLLELVSNKRIYRVSGVLGLHNDILLKYIELGFIGCFFWILFYFAAIKKLIEKWSISGTVFYLLITTYSFIIYTTDNTTKYLIFQIVYFILILKSRFLPQFSISIKSKRQHKERYING